MSGQTALCGTETKSTSEQWSPGTLSYVGGISGNIDYVRGFMTKAFEETGPGKVLSINLEAGICGCALSAKEGIEQAAEAVEGTEVEERAVPPTPAGGLQGTEQVLRDNPDTKAVVTTSPDQGRGVVAAIEKAGQTGKVKVFIIGAEEEVVKMMENGKVAGAASLNPGSTGAASIQVMHDAIEEATVPRLVINNGLKLPSYAEKSFPFLAFLTPRIIEEGKFTPESASDY